MSVAMVAVVMAVVVVMAVAMLAMAMATAMEAKRSLIHANARTGDENDWSGNDPESARDSILAARYRSMSRDRVGG